MEELGSVKLKCRLLKEENKGLVHEKQSLEEINAKLELQLEVSRRDGDSLLQQLQQREQVFERLKEDIISLCKLNEVTQQLDETINSQRPSSDKTCLGYQKHHEKKDKEP